MKFSGIALVIAFAAVTGTQAQFTCTLSAKDEPSCLSEKDDSGESCVWCKVSSFGFCVDEKQAEAMEDKLPTITCDRNSGPTADDDSNTVTDDDASPNPPPPPHPTQDDDIKPDDDTLPKNYWTCLKQKDAAACGTAEGGCTWCRTKAGFGLCLAGPSADMAKQSDWFDCAAPAEEESSWMTWLWSPAEEEEEEAEEGVDEELFFEDVDEEGMAADDEDVFLFTNKIINSPYDTSCVLAYLQDPTEEGCKSTKDENGDACEYCDLQGIANLCLTSEQAQMAAQVGITCDASGNSADMWEFEEDEEEEESREGEIEAEEMFADEEMFEDEESQDEKEDVFMLMDQIVDSPYDTSCVLAYLQDPTEEGCKSSKDENGDGCEYCDLQGFANLCLTSEQAQMAAQIGVTCDASNAVVSAEE